MDDIARRAMPRAAANQAAPLHYVSPLALAVIGLGLLPALAAAQPFYPRVVGSGENSTIEYGPGPRGNVVGGGRVVVSGGGEHTTLGHLDPEYAQPPRVGVRPVTIGSGESETTLWVPTDTDPQERALFGADGLPPETQPQTQPEATPPRRPGRGAPRWIGPRS